MLETLKEKWDEILLYLKNEYEISNVSFQTWLLPLEIYSLKQPGNIIQIIVPDANFLGYIKKKYSVMLKVSIEEVTGIRCDNVEFIVEDEIIRDSVSDNQLINATPNAVSPVTLQNANLNPKYTFDSFVVGANNNLAHAASLAVAESPGEIYNPLFIYGGVGLGKTHLMQSIANFILKNNPKAKILYVTSEKFTNELIDAIRNKNNISTTEFREKYRNNDVLLIDDIQFIIGKESTQEEFFHTFTSLYESKKQIVISSDKPPKDINGLEDRLTVDIQPPNYETRMAILKKRAELDNIEVDDESLNYIATNIKSSIRELEGALKQIYNFSRLRKRQINFELTKEALENIISPEERRPVTCELIIDTVAEHFHISPEDVKSTKRNKEIAYPRQICMYLCRKMTADSLQAVGNSLGKKDHTTIIHGEKKISDDLKHDDNLKNTIDVLIKKINPPT